MDRVIYPDIFNGHVNPVRKIGLASTENFSNGVKAFFTRKSLGVDIKEISIILSIKKQDIYLPLQRHTDKVITLENSFNPEIADAVITGRKGVLIGVQVADCVPVLLLDKRNSTIGAVHAGWRGTAAQIIPKTIESMMRHFNSSPEDIHIAIGPSIRWSCYQVGYEVKNAICNATGDGEYYIHKDGRYCIDLSSANKYQAISMGVLKENIWISHECTYCDPKEYYSYRHDKGITGSQGGFIGVF
jgi:YfiH family protein